MTRKNRGKQRQSIGLSPRVPDPYPKRSWSWRRCRNPTKNKVWRGPWVAFRRQFDYTGMCHIAMLKGYIGPEAADKVRKALEAGKQAGRF